MEELEKLLQKLKDLSCQSKPFAFAIVALLILIVIAFPGFAALVVSTTLIFLFIKGMILIVGMINDK